MEALNFYSPVVADQLRHRRKTATIRLGDKSGKYRKGQPQPTFHQGTHRGAFPACRGLGLLEEGI